MDETKIISSLVEQQGNLDFSMRVGKTEYHVESFSIENSQTPVTRPTLRGGVYLSNPNEFKIRATFLGTSLAPVLSGTMLGPSTDFEKIKFLTDINFGGSARRLEVVANLINYVQRGGGLELNLIVVGAELSD
jgi:hypothetical protein